MKLYTRYCISIMLIFLLTGCLVSVRQPVDQAVIESIVKKQKWSTTSVTSTPTVTVILGESATSIDCYAVSDDGDGNLNGGFVRFHVKDRRGIYVLSGKHDNNEITCVYVEAEYITKGAVGVRIRYRDGMVADEPINNNGAIFVKHSVLNLPYSEVTLYDVRENILFHQSNE